MCVSACVEVCVQVCLCVRGVGAGVCEWYACMCACVTEVCVLVSVKVCMQV